MRSCLVALLALGTWSCKSAASDDLGLLCREAGRVARDASISHREKVSTWRLFVTPKLTSERLRTGLDNVLWAYEEEVGRRQKTPAGDVDTAIQLNRASVDKVYGMLQQVSREVDESDWSCDDVRLLFKTDLMARVPAAN